MAESQFDAIGDGLAGILSDVERSILSSIQPPIVGGDDTLAELIEQLHLKIVSAVESGDRLLAEKIQGLIGPLEIRLIQADKTARDLEAQIIALNLEIARQGQATLEGVTLSITEQLDKAADEADNRFTIFGIKIGKKLDTQVEEQEKGFTLFGMKIGESFNKTMDAIDNATGPIMQQVTEIIPGFAGILEAIIVPLLGPVTDVFSNPSGFFKSLLDTVITGPLSNQLGIDAEQVDEFIVSLESDEDVGEIVKQFTGGGVITFGIAGLVFLAMAAQSVASSVVGATLSGAIQNVTKRSNRTFHPTILTVGEFQEAWRREIPFADESRDDMRDQGFTEERIDALVDLARTMLPAAEGIALWRRDEITEGELTKRLGRLGFDTSDSEHLKTLAFAIPGVSDIIRMAVREVFTPEIAEKFGQFEDIPDEFLKWAKVGGLEESWARNFWAAHWELPSVGQAFEMFHRTTDEPIDDDADIIKLPSGETTRNVIGRSTMEALLRAQDVMPFWRDKITAIAFRPLTRVDVRRMHARGVLTEDDVFRSYLDIGYSPANAQRMLEFTIAFNQAPADVDVEDVKLLTRTQILNFLEDGLYSEGDALDTLTELGYALEHAVTIVESKILDMNRDIRKLRVATIKEKFVNGVIDFNEATEQLAPMGLGNAQTQKILADMEGIRQSRIRIPSRTDMDKFIQEGLIAKDEYLLIMGALGYQDPWPGRYLELALKG